MLYSIQPNKSDFPVPISLRIIGLNHLQQPVHRPKGLSLYQWFYCVKGNGEFIIKNKKFILSQGEVALLYPDEPHSYRGLSDDWTLHIFAVSGSLCANLLKVLHMQESNVYHLTDKEIFLTHIQTLSHIYECHTMNKNLAFSKETYNFILDLSTCITQIDTRVAILENELIRRMTLYLEENYAAPFSLSMLSEYMHLSKEYLCTFFKKEMNQTILQYLLGIRINHARIFLIQYPEKKNYEIGQMCGFESPSYFIKVFHRTMGCTPEEYKRKNFF